MARSDVAVSGDTPRPKRREARLDLFRGLALLTIFVNHVPGTPYENWTSRNFGFSDAAEAFFVMSGIAAALAYSGRLAPAAIAARGPWAGIAPIWSRAWTLYLVHLLLTAWAIAILAAAADVYALPELVQTINLRALFVDPLGTLVGIPLLTHQLGYVNILPVYAVLLLVTPPLLVLGQRSPGALAAGSALLWFVTGLYRLNLPNYPNPGGWFFNPFAWQALFVCGLLVGLALRRGERLVAVSGKRIALAAGFVLLSLVWRQVPPVGTWFDLQLWKLGNLGFPFHLVGHDKTFLALPRLLHVLALLYLVSALPVLGRLAEARALGWLRLLGRQGLLVFAFGTVLAILGQALLAGHPGNPWLIYGIAPAGIALQVGAAWLRERAAAASARREVGAPATPPIDRPVEPPSRALPLGPPADLPRSEALPATPRRKDATPS